jgi:hypothetical protein
MADITPPRNVVYFNNGTYSLTGIVNLPYTDVIIGFMYPDDNFNLYGSGGAFDDNLQANIISLQNAGKNVLISFGGSNTALLSSAYQYYAQDVPGLVSQIVNNFVKPYGFNGVDIDYEDDAGFTGTYDGIGFLSALTSDLAQALPSGQNIITHAPQIPYWDANYYNAPYAQIWQRVANQITWINNQFYDQPGYVETAADFVTWYQKVAAITGPQKSLVGAILDPSTQNGYITLPDMINNVITPLKATFGSAFGGAMAWEFYLDIADQGGIWGTTVASALGSAVALSGSWNTNDLTAATNAQTAAGKPSGYVYNAQAMMHVEFRGIDGHIYDLWWQNGWNVNDLTAATNAQTAAGDPSGYIFDAQGTQHVVYLGTDNHIHELYWENGWSTNDLTAATNAQTAAGNPNGYVFDTQGTLHVVYRGSDAHIYDLWWQNGWNVNDLTTATDAMVAAGDPNGFVFAAQAQMHVVYRGTDNHIYDLWWQNGWNVNDLTAATNAVAAVGNPSGYVYDAQNMMHVSYRGTDNHIYDLWWQNGWNVNDLTAATNAVAAAGDPSGYMFDAQGTQHIVYRGTDNDIHELYWENGWSVNDLTAVTNAPAAAGDPDGFVFAALQQMHVVYLGADSHIHEFWWQSTGS